MDCNNEKCENGYVTEPDYQHEVMIRTRCDSCGFNEYERDRIALELSKYLDNKSKQYLAKTLATAITRIAYNQNELYALEEQIQKKNPMGIISWISLLR